MRKRKFKPKECKNCLYESIKGCKKDRWPYQTCEFYQEQKRQVEAVKAYRENYIDRVRRKLGR